MFSDDSEDEFILSGFESNADVRHNGILKNMASTVRRLPSIISDCSDIAIIDDIQQKRSKTLPVVNHGFQHASPEHGHIKYNHPDDVHLMKIVDPDAYMNVKLRPFETFDRFGRSTRVVIAAFGLIIFLIIALIVNLNIPNSTSHFFNANLAGPLVTSMIGFLIVICFAHSAIKGRSSGILSIVLWILSVSSLVCVFGIFGVSLVPKSLTATIPTFWAFAILFAWISYDVFSSPRLINNSDVDWLPSLPPLLVTRFPYVLRLAVGLSSTQVTLAISGCLLLSSSNSPKLFAHNGSGLNTKVTGCILYAFGVLQLGAVFIDLVQNPIFRRGRLTAVRTLLALLGNLLSCTLVICLMSSEMFSYSIPNNSIGVFALVLNFLHIILSIYDQSKLMDRLIKARTDFSFDDVFPDLSAPAQFSSIPGILINQNSREKDLLANHIFSTGSKSKNRRSSEALFVDPNERILEEENARMLLEMFQECTQTNDHRSSTNEKTSNLLTANLSSNKIKDLNENNNNCPNPHNLDQSQNNKFNEQFTNMLFNSSSSAPPITSKNKNDTNLNSFKNQNEDVQLNSNGKYKQRALLIRRGSLSNSLISTSLTHENFTSTATNNNNMNSSNFNMINQGNRLASPTSIINRAINSSSLEYSSSSIDYSSNNNNNPLVKSTGKRLVPLDPIRSSALSVVPVLSPSPYVGAAGSSMLSSVFDVPSSPAIFEGFDSSGKNENSQGFYHDKYNSQNPFEAPSDNSVFASSLVYYNNSNERIKNIAQRELPKENEQVMLQSASNSHHLDESSSVISHHLNPEEKQLLFELQFNSKNQHFYPNTFHEETNHIRSEIGVAFDRLSHLQIPPVDPSFNSNTQHQNSLLSCRNETFCEENNSPTGFAHPIALASHYGRISTVSNSNDMVEKQINNSISFVNSNQSRMNGNQTTKKRRGSIPSRLTKEATLAASEAAREIGDHLSLSAIVSAIAKNSSKLASSLSSTSYSSELTSYVVAESGSNDRNNLLTMSKTLQSSFSSSNSKHKLKRRAEKKRNVVAAEQNIDDDYDDLKVGEPYKVGNFLLSFLKPSTTKNINSNQNVASERPKQNNASKKPILLSYSGIPATPLEAAFDCFSRKGGWEAVEKQRWLETHLGDLNPSKVRLAAIKLRKRKEELIESSLRPPSHHPDNNNNLLFHRTATMTINPNHAEKNFGYGGVEENDVVLISPVSTVCSNLVKKCLPSVINEIDRRLLIVSQPSPQERSEALAASSWYSGRRRDSFMQSTTSQHQQMDDNSQGYNFANQFQQQNGEMRD